MTTINQVLEEIEITRWTGDNALIYQSWLKSFIGQTPFLKGVPAGIAYRQHRKVIDRILRTADVITMTLKTDPDFIIGYIIAERMGNVGIVHYVYVKRIYQNIGVAALLINFVRANYHKSEHISMYSTHATERGVERLHAFGLVYNPYLIFGDASHEIEIAQAC